MSDSFQFFITHEGVVEHHAKKVFSYGEVGEYGAGCAIDAPETEMRAAP